MPHTPVPLPDTTEGGGLIRRFSECYETATGKPSPQVRYLRRVNRFRVYHRNGRRWAETSALGLLNKIVILNEITQEKI